MGSVELCQMRLGWGVKPRSRMGVTIRPQIHARVGRIRARLNSQGPTSERSIPDKGPPARPNRNTKLSPQRVKTLRRLYAKGATFEVLARRFHVAVSTVWRAVHGVTRRS